MGKSFLKMVGIEGSTTASEVKKIVESELSRIILSETNELINNTLS